MLRQLTNLVHRIKTSLARRGVVGTLHRVVLKVQWFMPHARRARRKAIYDELEFDRVHHIDTAGCVTRSSLRLKSRNWIYGFDYYPIPASDFQEMMAAAEIDFPRFTFVDLGAGKGRAVLLATEYPFAKIVGVEFSIELLEVAKKNLDNYVRNPKRCQNIQLECMDAAEYPIPDGPLVLYLYNPFQKEVMVPVIQNVERSLENEPREIIVVYHTPEYDELWARAKGLKRTISGQGYSIYRAETGSGSVKSSLAEMV